jgi:hypothetical protein
MYSNPTHGTPTSGYSDASASDGRSLKLTLNPNPPPGVGGAPAAETLSLFQYGTYWARVKTANCSNQPKAGVVTGVFTYFNDGSDSNGNGLPDNSEIDFEWLCARPEVIHLSIWTDYLESNPPQLRVVYRTINIKTGVILMECYREAFGQCQPLSTAEKQPTSITPLPSYDSVNKYYEYGLIVEPNRVRFLMVDNGVTYTWWDYRGPTARIPKQPMHFMHNVWHTNDWYPIDDPNGEAVQKPTSPVNAYVDYSSFTTTIKN